MRQQGLFKGEVLTEQKLEAIVAPYYDRLWRIIREPFEDLLRRRADDRAFTIMDEGETAQWMRPQIVERARQVFDGDPAVKVEKRRCQLFLRIREDLAITPKKFRRDRRNNALTFSSYDTPQNMSYWLQQATDGMPNLPRLIVGYEFIDQMTEIKIWVAYPMGKSLRTCFLVPDQGGIKGVFIPTPDESPEEEDKGFRVTPKKRDSKELG